MKRVLALCLLSLISMSACSGPKKNYDAYYDFLSVEAEEKRLAALGVVFTEEGDAADGYMPYLNGQAQITQMNWFANYYGDAEKQAVAVNLATEDLDILVQESRKKECNIWGKNFFPNQSKTHFQDSPGPSSEFRRLIAFLMTRGEYLFNNGEYEKGKEQFFAVYRILHHFEKEPSYYYFQYGFETKIFYSERFIRLLEQFGLIREAELWKKYLKTSYRRVPFFNEIFQESASFDEDELFLLVENEDFPKAIKLQILTYRYYGLYSKADYYRCSAIGPPGYVKEAMEAFAKQSELNEMFIQQLKAHEVEHPW